VPIEAAPEVVLAFEVDPKTWFDTWRQLRNAVGALGMWPLATSDLGWPLATSGSGNLPAMIPRGETQWPDGLDATPSAILARVPDVDVDRLLDAERASQSEQWVDNESHLAWMIRSAALDGVDVERLHRELGESCDHVDVERWLLDIELSRGLGPSHSDGYLDCFVPPEAVMLLLPTTVPWAPGAYVAGFEWGYPHTDLRTALLRRWHQRHGAEMAANWLTMQQLVVPHPPANIEEA
jgi:hypothetical protein